MRAVVLTKFGGPQYLEAATLPDPVPGPGEVLLRVRACALNHLDLWIRAGLPGSKVKLPHILGCDAAGEVVALGPGAEGVALGGRFAVHPGRSCARCDACRDARDPDCPSYGIIGAYGGLPGAYAELLAVPIEHLLSMPDSLSFIDAAAVPLTFLTAWHMLTTSARLRPGETVLVVGAGAGISVAAIQIAKLAGARVIATSTSKEKLEGARGLGADETIHHPPEDLVRAVRRLTKGRMADVVFEHVGVAVLMEALKCLRPSGRLVTCGATSGALAEIDLRYVFSRRLSLLGSTMGNLAEMRRVWALAAEGRLKPVVDRAYPLEQASQAHERLEAGGQFGKVVLTA